MKNIQHAENGLKFIIGFEPVAGFRYEHGVSLGECEVHNGSAFGMHSYMNSGLVRSSVIVGRYCSIGRNVILGSGAHDFGALSTSPYFKNNSNPPVIKFADPRSRIRVLIGHDVWIGDNAYIMSGIKIGNGSIIASGSVVTKDVAPYSNIGGVPSKLLKMRFSEDVIHDIESIRWYELPPEKLKDIDIGNLQLAINLIKEFPESSRITKAQYSSFR
jgi:acetyltransferase-like isoleucine patch superfamily enzyme